MRSSYATAYYLAFMLQQMCDNVHLLTTSTSDLPTALSDVRPEDCLLVISYARYTSSSYDIVSHFHRAGCKIVALTDSLTSPIALKATEVLIAPNGGNFSPVGAITLCNCFITSGPSERPADPGADGAAGQNCPGAPHLPLTI